MYPNFEDEYLSERFSAEMEYCKIILIFQIAQQKLLKAWLFLLTKNSFATA
jgi:hypothetical protein